MTDKRRQNLPGRLIEDPVSPAERALLSGRKPAEPARRTAESDFERRLRRLRPRRRRFGWLWAIAAGAVLLITAILLLRTLIPESFEAEMRAGVVLERVPQGAYPLYYASISGDGLVEEMRLLPHSDELATGLQTVIEALIAGPAGPGISPWPAEASLRDVFVSSAGIAYVHFGGAVRWLLPRGDYMEWALVASVTRTICASFPEIRGVRILVDDQSQGCFSQVMPLEWTYRPAMFGG